MKSFSADWLALREPCDARARDSAILEALESCFADRASIAIADLGCGAGATLRAIASRLPARQTWRLVDNDPRLLALAAASARAAGKDAIEIELDLGRRLEAALDGALDLVTASALLDLVSAPWLDRLATEVAARRLTVYAALTYDGRITLQPADPLDAGVVRAVNANQRGEKGFGPALGPTAASEAIARFERLGFEVTHATSDWRLGPDDAEIQRLLAEGWAAVAHENGTLQAGEIDGWLDRRRDHIARGGASVRVGHIDFLARPPQRR